MTDSSSTDHLVIVDYNDLKQESSSQELLFKLEEAFGSSGKGVIGIRNVPEFVKAKDALLPLGHSLAKLPPAELTALEDPDSMFNAGWSHGKEKLKKDVPDLNKASFYFNPLVDVPGTPEDRIKYPASYPSNKWPKTALPELEPAAKNLGTILKNVAVELSRHIDAYASSKNPKNYQPPTLLYDALKDTIKAKGRLLYYYPLSLDDQSSSQEDSWIGWHNDSGFLTCLAGDLYLDAATGTPVSPPEGAGLYICNRKSEVCHVHLPADCIAIQIGECTEIVTGGAVQATPHCVRAAAAGSTTTPTSRVSLACFIDTPPSFALNAPKDTDLSELLQEPTGKVPPLKDRWSPGQTFGDFLATTFQMYYDWGNNKEE